ncbi:IucA/IucC family protein [Oceanospirillum sediminis]|uniref:IucA/IucC family siderophore biosynthesis protein n=1 Tax=Oceanospirillum sediminis TaxID=2760088 RepID=A0A839ILN7_9GAMM|nr:IucA/IucC family siderophore biosynthesis protein [Oceanospirillum sediminis]MBB1485409.1 IucA/IucC family siderophore biosynthesis protein [Oceanospirillum sediminis]
MTSLMQNYQADTSLPGSDAISALPAKELVNMLTPEQQRVARSQADENGLYRLLRCVLRERIFRWQVRENRLYLQPMESASELSSDQFWLDAPEYDDMGNLVSFSACFYRHQQQCNRVTDPVAALDYMLQLTRSRDASQHGELREDFQAWTRIRAELENSSQNEALTLVWRTHQDQQIRLIARQRKLTSMLTWAQSTADSAGNNTILPVSGYDGGKNSAEEIRQERFNSAILLEQWSATGHPYHPGSKTKLGFSIAEVLAYAPEFSTQVPLVLIAVHRSLLQLKTLCPGLNYSDWFAGHYPQWFSQWQRCFNYTELNEFWPVPVHPWQLAHELPQRFAEEIHQQKILLSGPEFRARPTLSVRTLAPDLNPSQPYIKLPVAAQMTSSVRNLSSPSVDNAPVLASIVQDIMTLRPDIASVLRCQWDEVGLHTCVDHEHRDDDRYLSVIFRRNPCVLLDESEHAVVVAGLFTPSALSADPLLIELMLAADVKDRETGIQWFRHYTDTLLQAVLDLYLDYGLALEAHQQNMMAVFTRQGQLTGFINRDVGGICVYQTALQNAGWFVDFTPAATLVDSRSDARVNISHAVMQSHIAEMIRLLDGYFDLTAPLLWQQVGEALMHRLDLWRLRLSAQHTQQESEVIWAEEYQAFFEMAWPGTAFISMRLQDQSQFSVSQPLENPLARYFSASAMKASPESGS